MLIRVTLKSIEWKNIRVCVLEKGGTVYNTINERWQGSEENTYKDRGYVFLYWYAFATVLYRQNHNNQLL